MALLHNNLLSDYVTISTHNPHAPTITTPAQGLQNRSVWSNRHPPVAVYRTGLTGNRLNSNPNLKSHVQPVPTGIPIDLTGLPAGMTGLGFFHFFEFKFEF